MPSSSSQELANVELELKVEKLNLEIAELKRSQTWNRGLGLALPLLSALIPLLALLFTVQQFVRQQEASARAEKLSSERAFMQPVLEQQMNTYFEASAAAATLASSRSSVKLDEARETFFRLYYGPLVMLESPEVSRAMKNFRACIDLPEECPPGGLQTLSLSLASSLQTDFFSSWNLSPESYAKRSIDYAKIPRND